MGSVKQHALEEMDQAPTRRCRLCQALMGAELLRYPTADEFIVEQGEVVYSAGEFIRPDFCGVCRTQPETHT